MLKWLKDLIKSEEVKVKDNADKSAFAYMAMNNDRYMGSSGLSKREYFTALAMQGCLSTGKGGNADDWVRIADDVLEALSKPKN